MASSKTQQARALKLLKARRVLRQKDFIYAGIAPETLARMVRDEAVVKPARGMYQLREANVAEAALLVPKGIVCLTSALQFHELTLQMPSGVWMAIERTAWKPKVEYPPIRFVRFSGSALKVGVARHRVSGVDVAITDPARTVVDCFKYRNKIGLDTAMEGLREGFRRRAFKPDDLWRYAQPARVWNTMRPYVEAMTA
jgi:predicted transcriptional regulator of viral defense system